MYIIRKVNSEMINEDLWKDIEPIRIDNFPWDDTGYKPKTEVRLCYTDEKIHVKFISCEKEVRIEEKIFNNPVWEDSCVEFFFMPEPNNDDRYFNFEINACGNLVLQLDNKPPIREYMTFVDPKFFNIKSIVNDTNKAQFKEFKPWTIEYSIPFSFIKAFFRDFEVKSGLKMRGNFTKCGDKTLIPHFGTWAEIKTESPAFHVPQFFKDIIFE